MGTDRSSSSIDHSGTDHKQVYWSCTDTCTGHRHGYWSQTEVTVVLAAVVLITIRSTGHRQGYWSQTGVLVTDTGTGHRKG